MNTNHHKLCSIIDEKRNVSLKTMVNEWQSRVYRSDAKYSNIFPVSVCPTIPKCKRSVFKLTNSPTSHAIQDTISSTFLIKLESSNVLNIVDSYAYDLQSLIGEVGGTLGLFLGLSMDSLVEFAEYVINNLFNQ